MQHRTKHHLPSAGDSTRTTDKVANFNNTVSVIDYNQQHGYRDHSGGKWRRIYGLSRPMAHALMSQINDSTIFFPSGSVPNFRSITPDGKSSEPLL